MNTRSRPRRTALFWVLYVVATLVALVVVAGAAATAGTMSKYRNRPVTPSTAHPYRAAW